MLFILGTAIPTGSDNGQKFEVSTEDVQPAQFIRIRKTTVLGTLFIVMFQSQIHMEQPKMKLSDKSRIVLQNLKISKLTMKVWTMESLLT